MGVSSLSSAFGWISIACWIVVYSPQIYENYKLQSGEGLSVFFVIIWLLGDLCNLAGAIMAGLQATVIILALYYSLCDFILLSQIYYYRYRRSIRPKLNVPGVFVSNEEGEESPLLGYENHTRVIEEGPSLTKQVIQYILAFVFVIGTGIIAWLVSQEKADNQPESGGQKDVIEWKSQLIGWTSAVLYLGSRIPQIIKNFTTKCEGLSLALFIFCIAGNLTYVFSICTESMSRQHLIANASWLAGSGLTVFLDFFVLGQFFYFRSTGRVILAEEEALS